jgi:methionyl-tRNA formyltransferase
MVKKPEHYFFINEKIDEGNILLQEELEILPDENAGSLHDRLMEMGSKLVVRTLDGLAENAIEEKPQPQVEHPKNAYKIFKEDTRINWKLLLKQFISLFWNVSLSCCIHNLENRKRRERIKNIWRKI